MAVPRVLRSRTFGRFFLGQSVSLLGDQFSILAVPLAAILTLHAGPASLGLLTAAGLLPHLFLSLPAGAFVDGRSSKRKVMLTADAVRAIALASIPVAYWSGILTIAQLYIVAIVTGCFTVLFGVAYQSLLVALVNRADYLAASSWLNGSRALTQLFGLTIGGAVVSVVSPPIALAIDAGSFLVSGTQLASIQLTETSQPPKLQRNHADILAGLHWISKNQVVRVLLANGAVSNCGVYMISAVLVLHAVQTLHMPTVAVGIALGLGAVGGLLGAITCGRVERRLGLGRTVVAACLVYPCAFMLLPLAPSSSVLPATVILGCGECLAFFGAVWADITVGAVQAQKVPDRLRGRVSGAYRTTNYGVRPVGAAAGGFIATAVGTRATLVVGACVCLMGGLLVVRRPLLDLGKTP